VKRIKAKDMILARMALTILVMRVTLAIILDLAQAVVHSAEAPLVGMVVVLVVVGMLLLHALLRITIPTGPYQW